METRYNLGIDNAPTLSDIVPMPSEAKTSMRMSFRLSRAEYRALRALKLEDETMSRLLRRLMREAITRQTKPEDPTRE